MDIKMYTYSGQCGKTIHILSSLHFILDTNLYYKHTIDYTTL